MSLHETPMERGELHLRQTGTNIAIEREEEEEEEKEEEEEEEA